MGLTWTDPEVARGFVRDVHERLRSEDSGSATSKPLFHVNFVLYFEPKALQAVLEEGAPAITFSWGMPDAYVELVRSFGALIGVQVGTASGAKKARDLGADFLVCQGVEAGGRVQSSTPLDQLLPEVLEAAGDTPVVAAGGLADAGDVGRILKTGANAAMLGTRFVATKESRAHPIYKQQLIEASETAMTLCFVGDWPHAQHRVLRNSTLDDWEAAGCPPPGRRPDDELNIGVTGEGRIIYTYEETAPRTGMSGAIDRMCLYAGTGVAKIRDLPDAAQLVGRLAPAAVGLPRT